MEDSKLVNFALHGWVKCEKFKGASAISAMLINFFLLVFKLSVCTGILILLAPHAAAQKLWSAKNRGILNKVFHVLFAIICFAIDIPVLLISAALIIGGADCLVSNQVFTGLIMGALGLGIGRWTLKCLIFIFTKDALDDDQEEHVEENEEVEVHEETIIEDESEDDDDDLRFCQLFTVGKEMCLLVDHVEMCPDETAFIRVAGEDGYTPIYKRKVRRDKDGSRFIVFNGYNCYLDDSKTQPIVPKK